MKAPAWVVPIAVLGAAVIVVPLIGLIARVEPSALWTTLIGPDARTALWLSIRTALAATLLCTVLGTPLGIALASIRSRWQSALRAIVLVPLVLPPVVGGLALLYAFGRRGLLGGALDVWGISLPFTTAAVILAQTFVSLPFMVMAVEAAMTRRSGRHEAVAATLGAGPTTVLRRVTLPAIAPAIGAGVVLAFARSVGEFGATLTFAGSLPGVTRTMPLEIYLAREFDPQAAIALSLLLVVLSIVVVAVAYPSVARRPS